MKAGMYAIFECLPEAIPLSQQDWPEETVPVVSICCITYNHSEFIREAVDGFLMQETTFPVEILIHDDASADGTAEIVREYEERHPRLIRGILQEENQYSLGRRPGWITRAEARGRYIAFCEGDDYWTHPKKLERQVARLRQDKSYVASCHRALTCRGGRSHYVPPWDKDCKINQADLIKNNPIQTASVLIRASAYERDPDGLGALKMGDWPRWFLACQFGSFHFDSRPMSYYRVHDAGVWSGARAVDKALWRLEFTCFASRRICNDHKVLSTAELGKRLADFVLEAVSAGDYECLWSVDALLSELNSKRYRVEAAAGRELIKKRFLAPFPTVSRRLVHDRKNPVFQLIHCYIGDSSIRRKTVAAAVVTEAWMLKREAPLRAIDALFLALYLSLNGSCEAIWKLIATNPCGQISERIQSTKD